jgi:Na+-driven multidrug efflux pump
MAGAKIGRAANHDLGHVLLVILKLAGWLLLIVAGCFLGLAKPETSTFYDKIYQTTPRQEWNMDLIRQMGPFLVASIACTPLGFIIYLTGIPRRKYVFPLSLVLTGLFSLTCLYAYLRYSPGF